MNRLGISITNHSVYYTFKQIKLTSSITKKKTHEKENINNTAGAGARALACVARFSAFGVHKNRESTTSSLHTKGCNSVDYYSLEHATNAPS